MGDTIPTETTLISSPYDYNCDAVGDCEYISIIQYEQDSSCGNAGNYSIDALVTNVCIKSLNDDTFFGAFSSHFFFCQNDKANWRACGGSPECDCNLEVELSVVDCYDATQFEFGIDSLSCLSRYYDPTTEPTTSEPTEPTSNPSESPVVASESNNDGLGTTAIALIIVFSVLFVIVVVALSFYLMKRKRLNEETM